VDVLCRSNNHCLDARSRSWGRREEAKRRYHCIEFLAIAVVTGHAWPNETELKFFIAYIGHESSEHDWSARRREMDSIRVRQRHDEPARRLFVRCTEALMMAHRFEIAILGQLVLEGLAVAVDHTTRAGRRRIKVIWLGITAAGQA
jgi:hypothetical protein